ncbi:HAD-IA family hydrolase [Micromonospora sp. CPCC 205371]|nr:HAD-IA family hydrolase [Micromonospora sp. CPCC 205371]
MPAYSAVLFDFFGTLTYSVRRGPLHAAVAQALGCDLTSLFAVLDRSFYARARGAYGSAEATLRWVCEQAGASPAAGRALRVAADFRLAAISADTRLRTDAVDTLRALRQRGLRTALVSDCTHELPALMPYLPVASLLDAYAYSVEIGHCKPAAEIYLAACARLGVAPEQCLYVGDGGSQELTGAAELGMTAVRLDAPDLASHLVFNADRQWSGPSVTVLSELIDLVDGAPMPIG